MNILFKRNYKLIFPILGLIIFAIFFWETRIISYNFWEYDTVYHSVKTDITNTTDILDDWIVHEIDLPITQAQYDYMLASYEVNREKDYVETDITIDWTLIENVWVRLKWNIDLIELLSEETTFLQSSLLIKFDKYVEWQTYQWLTEISLRVDSEDSLLWQLISYKLSNILGLYAPTSGYSTVSLWDLWDYLYIVSEVVNDEYVEQNFSNTNWVLYKSLNSLSFTYLGEDPTSYTDLFEQKTSINNNDLSKLIDLLKFVSESSDEEFEENFENYIDLDSYISMIAMDDVLWNHDLILWLLNNYYIYIDIDTRIASFIIWDQKLSFWNIWENLEDILVKYYTANDLDSIDDLDIWSFLKFTKNWVKEENISSSDDIYKNDLKVRFLENKTFSALYDAKVEEYKSELYDDWLAENILSYFEEIFLSYDDYSEYINSVTFEYSVNTISEYFDEIKDKTIKNKNIQDNKTTEELESEIDL